MPKAKEPIRLRFKKLTNGNRSIYLDRYVNGCRSYEFLRLYLVPETDETSRMLNEHTLKAANVIKARRIIDLVNERAEIGLRESTDLLLTDYLARHREECAQSHRGLSYLKMMDCMENHLRTFLGKRMAKLRMRAVDVDMCRSFAAYLRRAKSERGRLLSPASVHHYFGVFRNMLSAAASDDVIALNPVAKMKKSEIPGRQVQGCDFLDAGEVARMATTACRNEAVRQAFMFSCFTGLRISDIRALRWENISASYGEWRMALVMKKTQDYISCKLSPEAVACLPRQQEGGTVFDLPGHTCVSAILTQWAKDAGVKKHVTFHTARHSYATMALRAGADLYTISKLLGHRSVSTTAVYAAVVDTMRDEATDNVGRLFMEQMEKQTQKQTGK